MEDNFFVSFKQPSRYDSLREIRQHRRYLRELLDGLEVRETEVYEERIHSGLSTEMVQRAKSLHDQLCMRHHVEQLDRSLPNQCNLHVATRWDHVISCASPFDDLSCDDQWRWIIRVARMPAVSG